MSAARVGREFLRPQEFNSLPENTVQWKKKLLRIEDARVLHFADGTTDHGFDLIVGADGAWWKVRPVLSDAQPYYSGIAGHSLLIPDVEHRVPNLYDLMNRGSVFSFSDARSIMAQQMGDGSINVATWAVRSADWQTAYDVHDVAAVKSAILNEYAGWHPDLVALAQAAEGAVTPRDLYMLPIGHKWEHQSGVTLIGDAAHVMVTQSQHSSTLLNTANEDAMKLAAAIIASNQSSSDLDTKVLKFEQDMFERATETQQLTYDMMNAMFLTPGAPREGIERYILRAMSGEMGPLPTMLLNACGVYLVLCVQVDLVMLEKMFLCEAELCSGKEGV